MVHAMHRPGAGALIAAAIVFLFSGGGYCYYSSGGHHHYHSGNHPPHTHPLASSPQLQNYQELVSEIPGRHPIAALQAIEGISVEAIGSDPGNHDDDDLRALADLVLDVNADKIGVPSHAGSLLFDRVAPSARGRTVHYLQLAPPADGGAAIPGAGMSFDFDDTGRLHTIDNQTIVAVRR